MRLSKEVSLAAPCLGKFESFLRRCPVGNESYCRYSLSRSLIKRDSEEAESDLKRLSRKISGISPV